MRIVLGGGVRWDDVEWFSAGGQELLKWMCASMT